MALTTDFPIQVVNNGITGNSSITGTFSVTIAASGTTSAPLFVGGASLVGFMTDAAFTSANISFMTSIDNVTYRTKTDSTGTPLSIAVEALYDVGDLGSLFLGDLYIKFVSSESQTDATVITGIMREV